MIIKGKARAGPGSLALHLGNAETNENISILETRGVTRDDLRGGLIEMQAMADGTRVKLPLYHASMSPELPHRLTEEQRAEAIDALEEKMGFNGNPRIVVLHEKEGREHIHIVWSRIDRETRHAISDSNNYARHEEVSRDLERRFGHDKIQGAWAEREGVERPERTPSRAELRQEERTGIKGSDVRNEISELFNSSDGPEAFRAALSEKGYSLAKGDRRDYVIIDREGGIHSLARRIEGINAAGLREFMGDLDKDSVPSIVEAQQLLKDKSATQKFYEEHGFSQQEITFLEGRYSSGDGYVNQTMAALEENKLRNEKLNAQRDQKVMPWEQILTPEAEKDKKQEEFEEQKKKEEENQTSPGTTSQEQVYTKSGPGDGGELSEDQQARMDRLLNAMDLNIRDFENSNGKDGGRGGRTR